MSLDRSTSPAALIFFKEIEFKSKLTDLGLSALQF
jgi:hypothetical protein